MSCVCELVRAVHPHTGRSEGLEPFKVLVFLTGFVIPPNAGITSDETGVSAGNCSVQNNKPAVDCVHIANTPETLRGEICDHKQDLCQVKPTNSEEWGSYFAGLVEGDGHFSKQKQIVISFSQKDFDLAIFLKNTFGHGHVRPIKGKKAFNWIVSDQLKK